MLVTLHRMLDLAAPPQARDRRSTDLRRAVSPEPRGFRRPRGSFSTGGRVGLLVARRWRGSRWSLLASSSPAHGMKPGEDACSLADHERTRAALGRITAAVHAAHLVGEGAPTTGARGAP